MLLVIGLYSRDCQLFPFLRHALDIREHYERKLERANNLYMELSAIMLQLEVREKELLKYIYPSMFNFYKNSVIDSKIGRIFILLVKHFFLLIKVVNKKGVFICRKR